MPIKALTAIGLVLMAFCGSALGRKIGLADFDSVLIAGFAIGVVILGQAPAVALRERVAVLEKQLGRGTGKDA